MLKRKYLAKGSVLKHTSNVNIVYTELSGTHWAATSPNHKTHWKWSNPSYICPAYLCCVSQLRVQTQRAKSFPHSDFRKLNTCYLQDFLQGSLDLRTGIQVRMPPSCPHLSQTKRKESLEAEVASEAAHKMSTTQSMVKQKRFLSRRTWAGTYIARRSTSNKLNSPSK